MKKVLFLSALFLCLPACHWDFNEKNALVEAAHQKSAEEVAQIFLKESLNGDVKKAVQYVDLTGQNEQQIVADFTEFQQLIKEAGGVERILLHRRLYDKDANRAVIPATVTFVRPLHDSYSYDVTLNLVAQNDTWKVMFREGEIDTEPVTMIDLTTPVAKKSEKTVSQSPRVASTKKDAKKSVVAHKKASAKSKVAQNSKKAVAKKAAKNKTVKKSAAKKPVTQKTPQNKAAKKKASKKTPASVNKKPAVKKNKTSAKKK